MLHFGEHLRELTAGDPATTTNRMELQPAISALKALKEPNIAFLVPCLPMLSGVVEFDVTGTVDFQPAKFMERNSLGPETKGCAVGIE